MVRLNTEWGKLPQKKLYITNCALSVFCTSISVWLRKQIVQWAAQILFVQPLFAAVLSQLWSIIKPVDKEDKYFNAWELTMHLVMHSNGTLSLHPFYAGTWLPLIMCVLYRGHFSFDLNIFYSDEMDWAWHWTRYCPLQDTHTQHIISISN